MPRKKTHSEFIKDFSARGNTSVEILGTYVNSSSPIECRCLKCGFIWSPAAGSLLYGHGCPKCANNQPYSKDEFVNKLREVNPNIIILGSYKGAHKPIECRCEICGYVWEPRAYQLLNKHGCPSCVHNQTSFMEQFLRWTFVAVLGEDEVISRDKSAIGKELDIYIPSLHVAIEPGSWEYGHSKKVDRDLSKRKLCKEAGIREFVIYDSFPDDARLPFEKDVFTYPVDLGQADIEMLINLATCLLAECSLAHKAKYLNWHEIETQARKACRRKTTEEFVEEVCKLNPNVQILGEFKTTKSKIKTLCKKCGHEWHPSASSLLRGHGCPKCKDNKPRKTTAEFIEELKAITSTIEVVGDYTLSTERIEVKCKKCGRVWRPLAYSLLDGKGCSHCSAIKGAASHQGRTARKTQEEFIADVQKVNPSIRILGKYVNNKSPVDAECLICGHKWAPRAQSLLLGHGCPNWRAHKADLKASEYK